MNTQAQLPRNFIFSFNVSTRPVGRSDNPEGQVVIEGLNQRAEARGRMLVFVICGIIKNFLTNSYFILHIHQVKGFKMRHNRYLYLYFSVRYS